MPALAWVIFGVSTVVFIYGFMLQDNYGVTGWGIVFVALGGVAALCVGIWMLSLHYERATCHTWAKRTGRETKFAYYNAFAWECLTKAHDGKWVPKNQIGDYNK